jgi:undecaprenyl pyrophosphate phosphatase UppP
MPIDPVVEAQKLRRERRAALRVLLVSGPITVVGVLVLVFGDAHLSPRMGSLLGVPVIAAFVVSFVAVALLSGIQSRDLANRFRPGSARAYDDE